jgi:ribosomal protein L11 methyltransferase
MEIGACSTSISDADRETEQEEPIFSGEEWHTATLVGDQGRDMWTKCDVAAHFAASADLALVAELVQETLDIKRMYEVNAVPDRDWVIHVQQSWNPILVEGIVLRFPWHTDEDVAKIAGDEQNLAELQLEGGVAFGTGEHPTTQLCLSWVQNVLRNNKVTSLMDYGAGSGVLGLAACAFNKSVKSIGVDIDVDAVRVANANAVVNGLNMQNYLPPLEESMASESQSVLVKAYQKEYEQILPSSLNAPVHDACVANILAGPLVTLAKTLAGLVKPGGALGLSGILIPQANMVVEAYVEYFDDVKVEKESGGWVLITGTRKVTES